MTGPLSDVAASPRARVAIKPAATPLALSVGVHALGTVAFVGYAAMALLSYTEAAALWRTVQAPRARAFFDDLAASLRPISAFLAGWLDAGRWPSDNISLLAVHCAALAVSTLACAGLLGLLARYATGVTLPTVAAVRRWAVAFMAVSAFAYPVFTQDFWLSAVWGRMIAEGINPYHQVFSEADLRNYPLDHFPMPMSYGPLWGLLSAAVMVVTGGNLLAAAILFKLVLVAAWWGCIWCAGRIVEGAAPGHQATTIAVLGWMPASVSQTVAEGHNDAAMVALALLWLLLLIRKHPAAPMALAASALCKFVSLPLAMAELIILVRDAPSLRKWVQRALGPLLLGIGVMALFYRSPQFFDGLRMIDDWRFLRPREAVHALGELTGLPLAQLALAVSVIFPLVALHRLVAAYREPSAANFVTLSIAVMAAVLFGAVGHVWPWYLIWGLAFAALEPSWWVSRFIVAVALLVPFTLGSWWIEGLEGQRDLMALGIYAFATAFAVGPRLRTAIRTGKLVRPADA